MALSVLTTACLDGQGEGVRWTAYAEKSADSDGRVVTVLSARADIRPGWHLYAVGNEEKPRLSFEARSEGKVAQLMVATSRAPTSLEAELPGDTSSVFADTVTFRLKLPQSSGMKPSQLIIHYQLCSDRYCLPTRTKEIAL